MQNQSVRIAQVALNPPDLPPSALKEKLPATARLFEALEAGYTPNFLDIMTVFSEIGDFYTNADNFACDRDRPGRNMSQNNCRFCC